MKDVNDFFSKFKVRFKKKDIKSFNDKTWSENMALELFFFMLICVFSKINSHLFNEFFQNWYLNSLQ